MPIPQSDLATQLKNLGNAKCQIITDTPLGLRKRVKSFALFAAREVTSWRRLPLFNKEFSLY